jgi:DNA-binding response OmpR family regulator
MRVLLVEDEPKVADSLREGLEAQGYEVVVEATGEGAFFRGVTDEFGVILLDLGLPGRDGLQILRALRERRVLVPTLVITARDAPHDRVLGLDSGADDYLVKPFSFAELLARIRAVSRRSARPEPTHLKVDELTMELGTRQVTRAGRRVDLTAREFSILEVLMKSAGEVVSRQTLAARVWKDTAQSSTLNNSIDVHIARLRRKVDADDTRRLIHTQRGVGFVLRREEP